MLVGEPDWVTPTYYKPTSIQAYFRIKTIDAQEKRKDDKFVSEQLSF